MWINLLTQPELRLDEEEADADGGPQEVSFRFTDVVKLLVAFMDIKRKG